MRGDFCDGKGEVKIVQSAISHLQEGKRHGRKAFSAAFSLSPLVVGVDFRGQTPKKCKLYGTWRGLSPKM